MKIVSFKPYKTEDFGKWRRRSAFLFFPRENQNINGEMEIRWLTNATWYEQLQNDGMGWTGWESFYWDKLPEGYEIFSQPEKPTTQNIKFTEKKSKKNKNCEYCGSKIGKKDKNCTKCGAPIKIGP